jgi:hypothetical protein
MLHVCVQRFDVTENLKKFCKILGTKQALTADAICTIWPLTAAVAYHRWLDWIVETTVMRRQPGTRALNEPACSSAKSTMAAAFLAFLGAMRCQPGTTLGTGASRCAAAANTGLSRWVPRSELERAGTHEGFGGEYMGMVTESHINMAGWVHICIR